MSGRLQIGKLHLSPERYFASFRACMAAIEVSQEGFNQIFGSMVPDTSTVLCEPGADLRVLAIGSGSGAVDSILLKKLLRRHNSVYNRVVEPSEDMIGRYKTLVREDACLGAVKFDWRQQTAEEYFTTKDDTKYHLINAIHVLYYVENLHATLRHMWEQLADDRSNMGNLQHKLVETFVQGDRLKTSLRHSSDVKQWLDAMAISYVRSEDEINIDVTECLKEDSKTGSLLLDFLTQTPDMFSKPEIKSVAMEYLRCNTSVIGDKILLQAIDEIIVAFKSSEGE